MQDYKIDKTQVYTEEEFLADRTHETTKPVIGLSFDLRDAGVEDGKFKLYYNIQKYNDYVEAVKAGGGQPFVLSFNDDLTEVVPLLDGLIICGGRDLHPKFYNEEVNGTIVSPTDFRFEFNRQILNLIPESLPVFGICWGMQFLNVWAGGSLVQDIPDKVHHANVLREISYEPGSWLHGVTGGKTIERCLHHQAVKALGADFKVTGYDDASNIPHAFECIRPGCWRVGVQFHPEIIEKDVPADYNPQNKRMIHEFVDVAAVFKARRPKQQSNSTAGPNL